MKRADVFLIYSQTHRARLLAVGGSVIAAIALLDWRVQPNVSLGVLYLVPIVLIAGCLGRLQILLVSVGCALLRENFAPFAWDAGAGARIVMILVAFLGSGLFVSELVRNRQLALKHLSRIQEMEEQMRVLIETSPAAILIIGANGNILGANRAAQHLLASEDQALTGQPISSYLPVFSHLLQTASRAELVRNRVECKGLRRNGDVFLARAWFSVYRTTSGPRLAAILEDASEDLRDREELGLHSTMTAFRVLAASVSHEVRNLSAAAAVVHAKLGRVPTLVQNEDYKALGTLVEGLKKIASTELHHGPENTSAGVNLGSVLDELGIILEPSLRETETQLRWEIAEALPRVRGDHHGLLQVFLNLTKNSIRAVQSSQEKLLIISARPEPERVVVVRFLDSGPGIAHPELLFQPFQRGADGAGLGLYVARAMVRALGGELRYEPRARGACFAVRLALGSAAEIDDRDYTVEQDQDPADRRPYVVS